MGSKPSIPPRAPYDNSTPQACLECGNFHLLRGVEIVWRFHASGSSSQRPRPLATTTLARWPTLGHTPAACRLGRGRACGGGGFARRSVWSGVLACTVSVCCLV